MKLVSNKAALPPMSVALTCLLLAGCGGDFGGLNSTGSPIFGSQAERPAPGLITNLSVVNHRNVRENVRVAFGSNTFEPGFVRVCFKQRIVGSRAMSHGVRGVNPFVTYGIGEESCATIPSTETLSLRFSASGKPSIIEGQTTLDLEPYDNGYVDFLYGVGG